MSQQINRIKVVYKNETKKFKTPSSYEGLLVQTQKAFGTILPKIFKFFYLDSDNDIISINCQEDLEEALESGLSLRLVVEESIENAKFNLQSDYSMGASAINM
jgi:hypothetical protein